MVSSRQRKEVLLFIEEFLTVSACLISKVIKPYKFYDSDTFFQTIYSLSLLPGQGQLFFFLRIQFPDRQLKMILYYLEMSQVPL